MQLTNKDSTLFSARNDYHKKDLKQDDHHKKALKQNDHQKKDLKQDDHHEKEDNGPAGEIQNQPNKSTLSTFKMIVIHIP